MGVFESIVNGAIGAAFASGVFSLILYKMKRRDEKDDKREDLTIAVRMILYDRIKHIGKTYINRGYVTVEEWEDLKAMHSVYHTNLKGNGFLDGLMKSVDTLPKHS